MWRVIYDPLYEDYALENFETNQIVVAGAGKTQYWADEIKDCIKMYNLGRIEKYNRPKMSKQSYLEELARQEWYILIEVTDPSSLLDTHPELFI